MPTPTATPYVAPTTDPAECDQRYDWSDDPQFVTNCPPSGHPAVDHVLRKKYNVHMKNKAARHVRGETTGSPIFRVIIRTSSVQAVDDVVAFLKSNGARNIYWDGEWIPGAINRRQMSILRVVRHRVYQARWIAVMEPRQLDTDGGNGSNRSSPNVWRTL